MSQEDISKLTEEILIVRQELSTLNTYIKDQMRHDLSKKMLTVFLDNLSDIRRFWEVDSSRETYEYLKPMLEANSLKLFRDKKSLLEFATLAAMPTGLYLEFGVAWGRSINIIAAKTINTVHGFDSFDGLPEDWGIMAERGAFKQERAPDVAANVKLHVGLFDATLPYFLQQNSESISLLHLDADLYSSTKYVLDEVEARIRPNSIIVFDEYFNYPGWTKGEFLAWQEFVSRKKIAYTYLAVNVFGRNLCQAVIRVDSVEA